MSKLVIELMIDKFVKVYEYDQIFEAVAKVAEDCETLLACVVDSEGRLKGIITLWTAREHLPSPVPAPMTVIGMYMVRS